MIFTVEVPSVLTDAAQQGQCFWYSTANTGVTGAAVTTTTVPMIWNPTGSNRMLHIIQINIGVVSGSVIAAHVAYGILLAAGGQIGAAQPVISYTPASPTNSLVGSGIVSHMNFAPATVSMTVGPAYMAPMGFSAPGANANGPMFGIQDYTWGKIVIPPGVAFFPYCSNAAIALVASVAVFGWEQQINPLGG